jgi:aspartate aminotransferase
MNINPDFSPAVHINLNVRGMTPSATVAINERCDQLRRQGRRVYKLGLGQSPFPVPQVMQQALRDHAQEKDYLPVKGLPALREAIAGYLHRSQNLDYSPDHVLVGPGTKELMFLVQLAYYGDLVIPSPSWVSYAPQARIIGRNLHWLPTDVDSELGVTAHALETLCRRDPGLPRLLILNYPGNPTGKTYSVEQLQDIADVARRYRVLLLADEIYGALTFGGEHVSIARFYPEGTIISNGLSKWAGAGGWRLGAFAFPDSLTWLLDGMAAVASETFTSTCAPIQYAAVKAFEPSEEIEAYLVKARTILERLCTHAWRRLGQAGAEVTRPRGGFYLFPSFEPLRESLVSRGISSGRDFCERLLQDTGVACLPGEVFGRPTTELSARIACVDFDGAAAMDAMSNPEDVTEAFLQRHCTPVMTAIDRMADWTRAI